MAVALRQELSRGVSGFRIGDLTDLFDLNSGAANEADIGGPFLKLVSNNTKFDDDGRVLDTPDAISRNAALRSIQPELHADKVNFGYSVGHFEDPGKSPSQPGAINATSASEIGRTLSPVSNAEQEYLARKKREDEQRFQAILESVYRESNYLRQLAEDIARIDKELTEIRAKQEELSQLRDEWLAGDVQYGATPEERKANKLRIAGKLGLSADQYTDANGAVDMDKLDKAIREEFERRQAELQAREEALETQRAELETKIKEANISKDQYVAQSSLLRGDDASVAPPQVIKANAVSALEIELDDSDGIVSQVSTKDTLDSVSQELNSTKDRVPNSSLNAPSRSVSAAIFYVEDDSQARNTIAAVFKRAAEIQQQISALMPEITNTSYQSKPDLRHTAMS